MQSWTIWPLVQAENPGQPGGCDGVVQGQRSDVFLTLKPRAGWGPPDVQLPLEPPAAAQGLGPVLSLTPVLGDARLKHACREGMLESQRR